VDRFLAAIPLGLSDSRSWPSRNLGKLSECGHLLRWFGVGFWMGELVVPALRSSAHRRAADFAATGAAPPGARVIGQDHATSTSHPPRRYGRIVTLITNYFLGDSALLVQPVSKSWRGRTRRRTRPTRQLAYSIIA
jgi:hypothetical protein